jgi:hypothetical protein
MALVLTGIYALVAVLLHAIWCRFPPDLSSVPKMVIVGALVGMALTGHLLLAFGLTTATLAGVLVYGLAIELYLFMSTLIFSSVSAIWLRRLRRGRARVDTMRESYSPTWMVDSRLERLHKSGLVAEGADRLQVTAKGLRMILTFGRLRAFFGHGQR